MQSKIASACAPVANGAEDPTADVSLPLPLPSGLVTVDVAWCLMAELVSATVRSTVCAGGSATRGVVTAKFIDETVGATMGVSVPLWSAALSPTATVCTGKSTACGVVVTLWSTNCSANLALLIAILLALLGARFGQDWVVDMGVTAVTGDDEALGGTGTSKAVEFAEFKANLFRLA